MTDNILQSPHAIMQSQAIDFIVMLEEHNQKARNIFTCILQHFLMKSYLFLKMLHSKS